MTSKEKTTLKTVFQDIFNIYLESDIAGDNEDRRKKLFVASEINRLIEEK